MESNKTGTATTGGKKSSGGFSLLWLILIALIIYAVWRIALRIRRGGNGNGTGASRSAATSTKNVSTDSQNPAPSGGSSSGQSSGLPINVDGPTLKRYLAQSGGPALLVLFYAPWCPHCRDIKPTFQQLAARSQGRFQVLQVDCEQHKDVADEFKIGAYPTIRKYKQGQKPSEYGLERAPNYANLDSFASS